MGYDHETLMDYIHLKPSALWTGAAAAQTKFTRLSLEQRSPRVCLARRVSDRVGWPRRMGWRPLAMRTRPKDGGGGLNGWTDAWLRGHGALWTSPAGRGGRRAVQSFAAWMVLGKSGLFGETAPAWAEHAPSRPTPRIPGPAWKRRRTMPRARRNCCGGRTAGGTTRARGSATVAGFRRAKGGDRANHLANDNGLAELVGRTARYAKCRQREPTTAAAGCRCAARETAILSAKMGALGQ